MSEFFSNHCHLDGTQVETSNGDCTPPWTFLKTTPNNRGTTARSSTTTQRPWMVLARAWEKGADPEPPHTAARAYKAQPVTSGTDPEQPIKDEVDFSGDGSPAPTGNDEACDNGVALPVLPPPPTAATETLADIAGADPDRPMSPYSEESEGGDTGVNPPSPTGPPPSLSAQQRARLHALLQQRDEPMDKRCEKVIDNIERQANQPGRNLAARHQTDYTTQLYKYHDADLEYTMNVYVGVENTGGYQNHAAEPDYTEQNAAEITQYYQHHDYREALYQDYEDYMQYHDTHSDCIQGTYQRRHPSMPDEGGSPQQANEDSRGSYNHYSYDGGAEPQPGSKASQEHGKRHEAENVETFQEKQEPPANTKPGDHTGDIRLNLGAHQAVSTAGAQAPRRDDQHGDVSKPFRRYERLAFFVLFR
ncbi:unnamed protein product, partial [Symbiodinium sp. KB8]